MSKRPTDKELLMTYGEPTACSAIVSGLRRVTDDAVSRAIDEILDSLDAYSDMTRASAVDEGDFGVLQGIKAAISIATSTKIRHTEGDK